MVRSLDDRIEPPGEIEWYVLGRIAEEFGLADVAAAQYAKISPPKFPGDRTVYTLVQRRSNQRGKPQGHAPKAPQRLSPEAPLVPSVPRRGMR